MNIPTFNKKTPSDLIDLIIKKLDIKNDAALSRVLEVAPPVISKIRNDKLPVGATLIIRIHELTDISISDIKSYLTSK